MSTFFKPYEGKRPYAFISYSHRNSDTVLNIISTLNDRKLRLWYDEGIPAGSDWPRNIDLHMRECAAVLFFLSPTALTSPNCYLELKTAVTLKKPILVIPLIKTESDEDWNKLFLHAELLSKTDIGATADAILSWKVLKRPFYRKWTDSFRKEWIGLGAAILLLAAAIIGTGALLEGRFDPIEGTATSMPTIMPTPTATTAPTEKPDPTPMIDPGNFPVRFPDLQQENAVRSVLGKSDGDILRPELAKVKELYFCGIMTLRSPEGITFLEDGTIKVNSATVIQGKISDLSVIGAMVYLERLALIDQPLDDLSPLRNLVLLKELYLSGNEISNLSALIGLLSLETLHIEHTGVRDLTFLETLPSLQAVTVSADMLPLTWTENKPFRVILVP